MHILFLTDNFPPETNAAASRVYERARIWQREGHRVTVITCAPNFPEGKVYSGYKNRWKQRETMDGIEVIRVKTFMAPNRGVALRILDFISFMVLGSVAGLFVKKPDVIVATTPQFFCGLGGMFLSKLRRKPFVLELSDLWPASIRAVGALKPGRLLRAVEKLELFLYRKSNKIIALTDSFADDLVCRGISASKLTVIRNGADRTQFAPGSRDEDLAHELGLRSKLVIGYIGTLGMAHGLSNVIQAAELLRTEPRIRFLFVGSGAERDQLKLEAAERGLSNIVFVDRQEKANVKRFWSLCDIALIHLRNDPVFAGVIPSKLFEAMAMGIPTLYSGPRGECSAIIEREDVGICIPPERPNALADAAVRAELSPGQLQTWRENCIAASPRYSREEQADRFLAVLKSVAAGRPELRIATQAVVETDVATEKSRAA